MTEQQIHEAIFNQKKTEKEDEGRLWVRLLRSLKIRIKPGKTLKKPISYIGVKGEVEF